MRNTKILDLAQINTTSITLGGEDFKVREPSALEMIRYRELVDETKGGSRAQGLAFLFETCIFNADMTKAFDKDDAMTIACGSTRVANPFISALMHFIGEETATETPKEGVVPKEEVPVGSSPSS
jgi:hypothetical protein